VGKREMPEEEPLNLVPIMNLVTILIPVLLMAIKSLELAVIDTTLPAIGAPTESTEDVPDKPPLALKLAITNMGIRILGADNYLYPEGRPAASEGEKSPPDITCKSNDRCSGFADYKWDELSKKLSTIKQGAQNDDRDSDNVVLIPESNIKYEVLVATMDSSRTLVTTRENSDGSIFLVPVLGSNKEQQKLFPNVVLAGGTNQ